MFVILIVILKLNYDRAYVEVLKLVSLLIPKLCAITEDYKNTDVNHKLTWLLVSVSIVITFSSLQFRILINCLLEKEAMIRMIV
jgi:hypothetical protein